MNFEDTPVRRVRVVPYATRTVRRKPRTLQERVESLLKMVDDPSMGVFESVARGIHEHDKTCASLPETWVGRRGGVSCPSDWWICSKCYLSFLYGAEGLTYVWIYDVVDDDYYEELVCDCCSRDERKVEYDQDGNSILLQRDQG